MEPTIQPFREGGQNLDPQTQNRLLNKIAHANKQLRRLDRRGARQQRRYHYWWNLKSKLEERLYGPMPTIRFMDFEPSPEVRQRIDDLERMKECLLCNMGFPRRYVQGFDMASGPDRVNVMHAIEGKFLFAEELTRNRPY
jgi:hypothetical protein